MRFEMTFTGNDEQLLALAEELSGGLDTPDLGDAMGFFITQTMFEDLEYSVIRESFTLNCWITFDNFQWEGIQK